MKTVLYYSDNNRASNILPDLSGNGNNGTMSRVGLTTDNLGNPYKAMSFDGVSSYVDCGTSNNLVFGNGTADSAFSICTRLKLTSNVNSYVMSKYSAANNAEYNLYTGVDGYITFRLYDSSTSAYIGRYNSNSTLQTGQWIDIVATYERCPC
jgi:hypothetical protein